MPESDTVLAVRNLVQEYVTDKDVVHAVSGVSFDVKRGSMLGLVGESGCGKSSAARAIVQEPAPTSGSVRFRDVELTGLRGRRLRSERAAMQMVFQDPYSSLNPRWTIRAAVEEPLVVGKRISGPVRRRRVDEMLELVGLDPVAYGGRKPRQLSGGQCQRAAIARALAPSPDLILFDEAVSSLDVSIQAQVLNLLNQVRREIGLTGIFIGHDLAVISYVCDTVGVMYLGRICELGPVDDVMVEPLHPYTKALLEAAPTIDLAHDRRKRPPVPLGGDLPSPTNPPSGCRFRTRCPLAQDRCASEVPELLPRGDGRAVACHFV